MPLLFDHDDEQYLQWLTDCPDGFVLNRRRGESADYLVLHRSTCHSISLYHDAPDSEAFTGRGYLKVCSTDLEGLRHYVQREFGRPDGSFTKECSFCQPYAGDPLAPDDGRLEVERNQPGVQIGFLQAIRRILQSSPDGLTPQQIRSTIKQEYPALYGTESQRRNVAAGHCSNLDNALLVQIYASCRQSRDISLDKSVKPLRVRLVQPSAGGTGRSSDESRSTSHVESNLTTAASAGSTDLPVAGTSQHVAPVRASGAAAAPADHQAPFDIENAGKAIMSMCGQLWRSTQEGEMPQSISAILNQLRASKALPYVTTSLMFMICAVRNAATYSDRQPSRHESEAARHAFAAIEEWHKEAEVGDTPDARVARLATPDACEAFIKNARRLNQSELADQALRRAVELRAADHCAASAAERECLEAIYAYEETLARKNGKRTRASRTWQMVERHGILVAAERAVDRKAETAGYRALAEMGLQRYAFEAVILRHPQHFSAAAVERSRERMKEWSGDEG